MPLSPGKGRAAISRSASPKLGRLFSAQYEFPRKAAPQIGAHPNDVALISSVGYGVATASKILSILRGSRVRPSERPTRRS